MPIQVTIIGLGQIGASLGLALAGKKDLVYRVGHDRDLGIARRAQKMGALDRVEINLPRSVEKADLVILALPVDQIRETLEFIRQDLREDGVIMDTGPVKQIVAEWATELLPPKRHYIGLTPVINPQYLHEYGSGIEAAHADLFKHGLMVIVSPPGANSQAVKLAADLTRLIGAAPLFADLAEVDGLMASTHLMPQLAAAAILNATVGQPGWREGQKLVGRAYASVSDPVSYLDTPQTLARLAMLNQENALRALDGLIAALLNIRADIESNSESLLLDRLERARQGREKWWQERHSGEWSGDGAPQSLGSAETIGFIDRLVGTSWRKKAKK